MIRLLKLPEACSSTLHPSPQTIQMASWGVSQKKGEKIELGLHMLSLNPSNLQKETAEALHPHPGGGLV